MPEQKLSEGALFGNYRIVRELKRGGEGVVYEAVHSLLERAVALKLLPPGRSEQAPFVRRLIDEARKICRVKHPNLVEVYDVDQHEGACYLAMELVPGGSAQDWLHTNRNVKPRPWREATQLLADVCRGLAHVHSRGLIHCDIKPPNILLGARGEGKLSDFGLARAPGPATAAADPAQRE